MSSNRLRWLAHSQPGLIDQIKHPALHDAIKDVPAIAPIPHQPGITQDHELLRDISLTIAKPGLHMTDTLLILAQNLKNFQTRWMRKRLKKRGYLHAVPHSIRRRPHQ